MDALLLAFWKPAALLIFGLWSLISPFSLAYLSFTAAYAWGLSLIVGMRNATLAISFGSMALWISLAASERRLPQRYPLQFGDPNAEAGFPFIAFRYPIPPMGNDVPPLAQWLPFFADYAFWLLVGLAVVPLLARLLPEKKFHVRYALLPAIAVTLLGFGHTLLKFD